MISPRPLPRPPPPHFPLRLLRRALSLLLVWTMTSLWRKKLSWKKRRRKRKSSWKKWKVSRGNSRRRCHNYGLFNQRYSFGDIRKKFNPFSWNFDFKIDDFTSQIQKAKEEIDFHIRERENAEVILSLSLLFHSLSFSYSFLFVVKFFTQATSNKRMWN